MMQLLGMTGQAAGLKMQAQQAAACVASCLYRVHGQNQLRSIFP